MTPYILNENDIEKAAEVFAIAFQNDPLYKTLEPEENLRRKLLPIFFHHYLKLMMPYSYLIADSASINGVALWYDDSKLTSSFKWYLHSIQAILGGLEMCRYISLTNYVSKLRTLLKMGSGWILEYKKNLGWDTYIHLDMLAVRPESRGKGYGHQLMIHGLETYISNFPASTIETHNESNVPYYEAYGYKLIEKIPAPNSSLVQYCMIRENK